MVKDEIKKEKCPRTKWIENTTQQNCWDTLKKSCEGNLCLQKSKNKQSNKKSRKGDLIKMTIRMSEKSHKESYY